MHVVVLWTSLWTTPQKAKVCKIILFWLYLYSQLSCLRNDEVITLTDSEDDTDSVVVIGSDTSEEPTESTQFTNSHYLADFFTQYNYI